jgi:hypothetical protein
MKIALLPNNNRLEANGYSKKEEQEIYSECLEDVYNNPQWYLDNLDNMKEFRCSFIHYNPKNTYK